MSQELMTAYVRHFIMHNMCVLSLICISRQLYKVGNNITHIWPKKKTRLRKYPRNW